jgi:hypothetical protein
MPVENIFRSVFESVSFSTLYSLSNAKGLVDLATMAQAYSTQEFAINFC